ncbi:MAG: glycosyltransferase [Planctomycetes bacterium]|nr:glycosyltransferase [Planctomycetota bacterium]
MSPTSAAAAPIREGAAAAPRAPATLDITAIVAVLTGDAELDQLVPALAAEFEYLGKSWEFVLVFDGVRGAAWDKAQALAARYGARIKTVAFEKAFGESVCLSAASEIALGRVLLTSPQYVQIDPVEIASMLKQLDQGADMAVPWRTRRVDPWLNRLQSTTFNWLMRKINGGQFHDLNCYFRLFKREVLGDITVYGDMYRFLPLIAQRQGFRVVEVQVRHLKEWGKSGFFGVGVYIRRFLDVVGVVFLTRFTLKPLRFFGSIGLALTLVGGVMLTYMIIERLVFETGLNERPAFLLALMLFSLGVQVIGFGLVGEIIIYTQARNLREYRIERRWDDDGGDELDRKS